MAGAGRCHRSGIPVTTTFDMLKGTALIGTFIGVLINVGVTMGECVASLSRAHPWCNL
jgi:hypothetical protein